MQLYRLLRREFAGENPFDGQGSYLHGGRWSSVGTRVCYTAAHRSLAILEYRANMDPARLPSDLVIATLDVPDTLTIADPPRLPEEWREYPAPATLRLVGDRFIKEARFALMRIPSVIVPEESNLLLNPLHADAPRPRKQRALIPFQYDARLL